MKPKISIIVPVHNLELYLGKCLDSILAQTFTDFEVIIVNDGSTDKSGRICEAYARQDSRVQVIDKAYGGVSSARNSGIKAAQGQYIGFVDGDDYINKDMYEVLYQLCRETKSDIGICKLGREIDGKLINKENSQTILKEMSNVEAMRELFIGNLYRFSLCNKLFRKTCFENIWFPNGRIHEDLATTYKLFAKSKKAIFTNYIGYVYIKRYQSILTSKFSEKRLDAFIAWNEILNFMSNYYSQLNREVYSNFGYWSVDNIHYILDQVENQRDKERYLKVIQQNISKHYKDLIKITGLSFKYKSLITMLNYNVYLLLLAITMKKALSKT